MRFERERERDLRLGERDLRLGERDLRLSDLALRLGARRAGDREVVILTAQSTIIL